jgi:hypothetical protein
MNWLKRTFPDGYYYCVSDKYTSGIPDIFAMINGVAFVIELKKPGKKPVKGGLQEYNLKVAKENGAVAGWTDSFKGFTDLVWLGGIEKSKEKDIEMYKAQMGGGETE